jgi:hypothetical protein
MRKSIKTSPWFGMSLLLVTVFALWLSAGSCTYAKKPAKAATAEQAFALAKNRIASGSFQQHNVFISNEPISGGSSIPTWGKNIKVPSGYDLAWFLFVDDQPDANWEHACRYFFVSVETGRFAVVPAKTPPDNWSDMKKIHSSGKRP